MTEEQSVQSPKVKKGGYIIYNTTIAKIRFDTNS